MLNSFQHHGNKDYVCYWADFAVTVSIKAWKSNICLQRDDYAWSNPSPRSSSKQKCCGVSSDSKAAEARMNVVSAQCKLVMHLIASSSWGLSHFAKRWWVGIGTSGNTHLPSWVHREGSGGLFPSTCERL